MGSAHQERIMVNGRISLPHNNTHPTEINRGMIILTSTGIEAGFSAGVVVPQEDDEVACILLGRLPVTSEYRLIPIGLIDYVDGENIHLNVHCSEILELHLHQPV